MSFWTLRYDLETFKTICSKLPVLKQSLDEFTQEELEDRSKDKETDQEKYRILNCKTTILETIEKTQRDSKKIEELQNNN